MSADAPRGNYRRLYEADGGDAPTLLRDLRGRSEASDPRLLLGLKSFLQLVESFEKRPYLPARIYGKRLIVGLPPSLQYRHSRARRV